MARNNGNSLLAVLAGIVIGVGAGVLLAPDEGKKTRKKIKKSFDEKTSELKSQINNLAEEVKSKTKDVKGSFEENVESLVARSTHKAEDVIGVLEKKIADLKKVNAKLQK